MNLKLKSELQKRIQMGGYLTIVSDDLNERSNFIENIKRELPEIEVVSEYSLKFSELVLRDKLQDHSIILDNLEEKLVEYRRFYEKYFKCSISEKDSLYLALIRYREYARNHPLILLCNRETATLISSNDANLSSFARSRVYLENYKDFYRENNKVIKFVMKKKF